MIDVEEPEEGAKEPEENAIPPTETMIAQIGQQITDAESARNHVVFNKLGEHLDALVSALSKLSVADGKDAT